jgi:hypothetical protein
VVDTKQNFACILSTPLSEIRQLYPVYILVILKVKVIFPLISFIDAELQSKAETSLELPSRTK